MRFITIIATITTVILLSFNNKAYCDTDLSYEDTVNLITEAMVNNVSDVRKESYGYIRFDKCGLEYNVLGTYPIGDLYNINYSNIDFSSLNYQSSKAGYDYTGFIILNFNNDIKLKEYFRELTVRTIVVSVSTAEKAQLLFKTFLHLGKLCGAPGNPQ